MTIEGFRWLAGLIAAHPDRRLVGRTRLQKEMWLLQRLEMPAGYDFRLHYFGPYSEGIQAELNMLQRFGMVQEAIEPRAASSTSDSASYSVFTAAPSCVLPDIDHHRPSIDRMAREDAVVLELAATYDMFRSAGLAHGPAMEMFRAKKGVKCSSEREAKALALLADLHLPHE